MYLALCSPLIAFPHFYTKFHSESKAGVWSKMRPKKKTLFTKDDVKNIAHMTILRLTHWSIAVSMQGHVTGFQPSLNPWLTRGAFFVADQQLQQFEKQENWSLVSGRTFSVCSTCSLKRHLELGEIQIDWNTCAEKVCKSIHKTSF